MTKEQKECVWGREWRKLLVEVLPIGKTTIVVQSVNDIKSIRSVASDINTDPAQARRISVNADRDVMQVELTVEEKNK